MYEHDWESLRAIQVAAADAIFNTDANVLLSSSTASGKTEAAFFPILTNLWEDQHVVYGDTHPSYQCQQRICQDRSMTPGPLIKYISFFDEPGARTLGIFLVIACGIGLILTWVFGFLREK